MIMLNAKSQKAEKLKTTKKNKTIEAVTQNSKVVAYKISLQKSLHSYMQTMN